MYPLNRGLKKLAFSYHGLFQKTSKEGVEGTEFPRSGEDIACRIFKG